MTQQQVTDAVNSIVNTYTGKAESYLGMDQGQCTVPVKYYVNALAGGTVAPSTGDDRADGYYTNFPEPLGNYFAKQAYQAGIAYPKGTILIWNSPHCAIVLSSDGSNTVEVFEQNADPDGSPCHSASRTVNEAAHTCIGALVPLITATPPPAAAPEPAPTPAKLPEGALNADSPPYKPIVKDIPGYTNATNAANHTNPADTVKAGSNYFLFTTKYGMDNVTLISGEAGSWINPSDNVVDPPPAPEPVPEPEPAALDVNATSPNTWKTAYLPFKDSTGAQTTKDYVALESTTVTNFDTGGTTTIKQYNTVAIAGSIVKNGTVYLRPWTANAQVGKWWLIPETASNGQPNLMLEADLYDTSTSPLTKKTTKTLSFGDYVNLFIANIELLYDKIFKRK